MILLNPGPVTLTPGVRNALSRAEMCHREDEFAALTLHLRRRLEAVYPEAAVSHTAVLLTGSGTAAVEAMLSTFAPRTRPTLVAANGVYGERMARMLERQGKPVVEVRTEWKNPIDDTRIAATLDANPEIAGVALVHHETTTGRLNRLGEIASVCRERGIGLLIDAVSSFGGEELRFDEWRPLAVAATAGKCLHAAPGLSFVLAERGRLARKDGNATTLYLDLEEYHPEQEAGWSPFTQAVPLFLALDAALGELEAEGGWRRRRERYRFISHEIRSALKHVGVEPLLPDGETSAVLSAFRLPPDDTYERIHDRLKSEGFVVYAGQARLRDTIFRIANMGAIRDEDLDRLTEVFSTVFDKRHA